MPKNKIVDLRDHLFAAMERLSDPECNLEEEIRRANALQSVGAVIIQSAKVEVEFLQVMGGDGSGFIPNDKLIEGKKK